MRKVLAGFIGLIMVLVGCIRIDEYEMVRYKAPNWASDGRIVFVEDYNFVRDKHGFWGYARSLGITNTSSAGEWVAVAMNTLGVKHAGPGFLQWSLISRIQ